MGHDSLGISVDESRGAIVFASGQALGSRPTQEDYFLNFNDECFVVADGVGSIPHGDTAARLGAETALWGYKLVRQRPFYWGDKTKLLKRIFRSANIAVWQKQRETGFADGLATTLVVAIVGPRNAWVGSVGDSSAWLLREGALRRLTLIDTNTQGALTKVVGVERFGLAPAVVSERFAPGETLLLATDGLTGYIEEKDIEAILSRVADTTESARAAVEALLGLSRQRGSRDNMTACIIKRIS